MSSSPDCLIITEMNQELTGSKTERRLGRNEPNAYRITVAGFLDSKWSERLGGMRIQVIPGETKGDHVTVMEGIIIDQSQLSGVLNTLHALNLTLLEVELSNDEK